ncbi:MAG: hypothetical protein CM1200mP10_04810 [Candidatus Neomarinimicrobiota bacterium]|nr:MAG: hypothetical protein CM1200mP10_04810 [Candidatus Neomarinimicrobiota bacterium]
MVFFPGKNPNIALTNAPVQERVLRYLKQNKGPVKLSVLKDITPNPSSVCKALLNKSLINWDKHDLLPDVTGFTFSPIHKKEKFYERTNICFGKFEPGPGE